MTKKPKQKQRRPNKSKTGYKVTKKTKVNEERENN